MTLDQVGVLGDKAIVLACITGNSIKLLIGTLSVSTFTVHLFRKILMGAYNNFSHQYADEPHWEERIHHSPNSNLYIPLTAKVYRKEDGKSS